MWLILTYSLNSPVGYWLKLRNVSGEYYPNAQYLTKLEFTKY